MVEIDSDDVLRLVLRISRLLLVLAFAYAAEHEMVEATLGALIVIHMLRSGSSLVAIVGTALFLVYSVCALLDLAFERSYLFFVLTSLLIFPDVDRQLDDKHPPAAVAKPTDGSETPPGSVTPPGTATPTPERPEEARSGEGEELKDETEAEAEEVKVKAWCLKEMPSQHARPPPHLLTSSTTEIGEPTPQKIQSPQHDVDSDPDEPRHNSGSASVERYRYLEPDSPAPKADQALDSDANLREAALQALEEDEELLEDIHQARMQQTLRNRRYSQQPPGDY